MTLYRLKLARPPRKGGRASFRLFGFISLHIDYGRVETRLNFFNVPLNAPGRVPHERGLNPTDCAYELVFPQVVELPVLMFVGFVETVLNH